MNMKDIKPGMSLTMKMLSINDLKFLDNNSGDPVGVIAKMALEGDRKITVLYTEEERKYGFLGEGPFCGEVWYNLKWFKEFSKEKLTFKKIKEEIEKCHSKNIAQKG